MYYIHLCCITVIFHRILNNIMFTSAASQIANHVGVICTEMLFICYSQIFCSQYRKSMKWHSYEYLIDTITSSLSAQVWYTT